MDIQTLSIISSIISLVVAVMLWFLHIRSGKIKGLKYWALCHLFNGAGLIAFSLANIIPPVYYLLVASTLNASGVSMFLAGTWAFKEKKVNWYVIYGLILLMIVTTVVFMYVFPNPVLRRVNFSLELTITAFLITRELFAKVPKGLSLAYRVNGFIFAFLTAGLFVRGVLAVVQPQTNVMASSLANNIIFPIVIVAQMASSFGIFLMVNYRIVSQLEETIASKSLIYSILAHDLKGHLGLIDGLASILSGDKGYSDEKQKKLLGELKKISASTYTLMDDLLDWARSQTGKDIFNPKIIGLKHVVDTSVLLVKNMANNKQIEFNYTIDNDIYVFADERMLSVILRNLLMNAVKFSYIGGNVFIELADFKTHVVITIKDYGTGIPKSKMDKLFDFGNTRPGVGTSGETGFGFGLFVCRDFVQINNGKITFESREGEGTTVKVTLSKN